MSDRENSRQVSESGVGPEGKPASDAVSMSSESPTLASARPDPRAGEDGDPTEVIEARWAAHGHWRQSMHLAREDVLALLRRLRAAEAENDDLRRHIERRAAGTDPLADHLRAKAEAAEAERDALREMLAVAEVHLEWGDRTLENIHRDARALLARASQGDPATGTRSVPRPTEEERG